MEVPLSIGGASMSSFKAAWRPFFPGVLLRPGDRQADVISSLNCTLLYASSRSTATARVCYFWNPSQTSYLNLAAFSQVVFPARYPPWFGDSAFLLSRS